MIQNFLYRIYGYLHTPNSESLSMSMADTHHPGLFSLVIYGTNPGRLTRVFIASEKLKPYDVQLHSHRYPITLTVLKGLVKHYVAIRTEVSDVYTTVLPEFEYKSPLNGGSGLKYLNETTVILRDYHLPVGSQIDMGVHDLHSVSCSKGAIWVVEEGGFESDSSRVLGVPFITEGLYNSPGHFQVNDNVQIVKKVVKGLIDSFKSVEQ